jgi:hypothetical protein
MATIRKVSVLLAGFILLVFSIFVFNQTVQIVQSAKTVNPTFGNGVMWALILLYCALLLTPAAASRLGRSRIRPLHLRFQETLVA